MASNLASGEDIPLFLTLESKDTGKFVRATIYDADGAQVGAVVSVAHLVDGNYFDDSRTMPSVANIIVVYDVFDDAGFTTPSTDDLSINERFDLDSGGGSSGGGCGVEALVQSEASIAVAVCD